MRTIMDMALEAGFTEREIIRAVDSITRFAALVRADERELVLAAAIDGAEHAARKAVADEREEILDLVDSYAKNNTELAAAIRARGNT